MIVACRNGETKVVQLLLERYNPEEIGLNIKDKFGTTPFMASCDDGHKDVVQLLLDHSGRIELNARDNDGWTAFMWACFNGHKDVVKLLLDHSERIELNARNNFGMTAFMLACQVGHKDVVKLLLVHSGIDVSGYKGLSQEMRDFIELHQEQTIVERRSKIAALREALSNWGARVRLALTKKA